MPKSTKPKVRPSKSKASDASEQTTPPVTEPTPVETGRKIAILGTTPSRWAAPINDPSWEIWTIGPGGCESHRWDLLFEVHHRWPEDFKNYLNLLSNVKSPQKVVTLVDMRVAIEEWAAEHRKTPEVLAEEITGDWEANAVLNRDPLFRAFFMQKWFSSSVSYCLAMAIMQTPPPEMIGLWGIDLEAGEEYQAQALGAQHLICVARHLGISIRLPKGCGLLRDLDPYPDRYESPFALYVEEKMKYVSDVVGQKLQAAEDAKLNQYRAEGSLIFARNHMPDNTELLEKLEKEIVRCQLVRFQSDAEYNRCLGEHNGMAHLRTLFVHSGEADVK